MSTPRPTKAPVPLGEIEAQLKKPAKMRHSTTIVFVEGVDDVTIYREITRKHDIDTHRFSFEQRGGRNNLFRDFEHLSSKPELFPKVVFFADKDTFVFNSIPEEYRLINFTEGYSIENDLFQDGMEHLMSDLSHPEKQRFESLIHHISEWFAFEIQQLEATPTPNTKIDFSGLNEGMIKPHSPKLELSFLESRRFQEVDKQFSERIKHNYVKLLRGKILFELLLRIYFDREETQLISKSVKPIWGICLTEGKRNVSTSNTARIATILSTVL